MDKKQIIKFLKKREDLINEMSVLGLGMHSDLNSSEFFTNYESFLKISEIFEVNPIKTERNYTDYPYKLEMMIDGYLVFTIPNPREIQDFSKWQSVATLMYEKEMSL